MCDSHTAFVLVDVRMVGTNHLRPRLTGSQGRATFVAAAAVMLLVAKTASLASSCMCYALLLVPLTGGRDGSQ